MLGLNLCANAMLLPILKNPNKSINSPSHLNRIENFSNLNFVREPILHECIRMNIHSCATLSFVELTEVTYISPLVVLALGSLEVSLRLTIYYSLSSLPASNSLQVFQCWTLIQNYIYKVCRERSCLSSAPPRAISGGPWIMYKKLH